MTGAFYYFLILLLAIPLRTRLHILRDWTEPARTAASVAVVQYFGTWLAFLAYFVFGMGPTAFYLSGLVLVILNALAWNAWRPAANRFPDDVIILCRRIQTWLKTHLVFISFVIFFCIPFIFGLSVGREGQIHFQFNFIDTAFHLSLSQAFLAHPRFPPMDLNAAGNPLVYHFMADFLVSFLSLGGLDLARTTHALNIVDAVISAVILWTIVERLLRNPRPIITGTVCAMFCFLIPALSNELHWLFFKPAFLAGPSVWERFLYPYFNFECAILNLFEPQRVFLFSLPIILVIIDAMLALWHRYQFDLMHEMAWLYMLLPFSHMTSFIVLGGYFMPLLVRHRKWWVRDSLYFLLPGFIAVLQVLYVKAYAPAFTSGYSGWDAIHQSPFPNTSSVPAVIRSLVYWLLVDGEFLVLGAAALIATYMVFRKRGEKRAFFLQPVMPFLGVSFCFFVLINFYRFSRNWGDSNKFVMYLNFWFAIAFGQMLAVLWETRRTFGKTLTLAALILTLTPYVYDVQARFHRRPMVLFSKADALAALWVAQHTAANDIFVTTPRTVVDFIPALAGRPVLQGMYIDTQPYYSPQMADEIQRVYVNADLEVLRKYSVKYIRVSEAERRLYHVHPMFDQPLGLVYSDGSQIRIYDARLLLGE